MSKGQTDQQGIPQSNGSSFFRIQLNIGSSPDFWANPDEIPNKYI